MSAGALLLQNVESFGAKVLPFGSNVYLVHSGSEAITLHLPTSGLCEVYARHFNCFVTF